MAKLLSFISGIKIYLYAALVVLLIIGTIWFVHHERVVGEKKIVAMDAKLAAAALQHSLDVTALAQVKSTNIGNTYAQTIIDPIISSPSVLCVSPHRRDLPKAASNRSATPGKADVPKTDTVNIGPPLDTIGRDADAQVNALIDQINVLTNAMKGETK